MVCIDVIVGFEDDDDDDDDTYLIDWNEGVIWEQVPQSLRCLVLPVVLSLKNRGFKFIVDTPIFVRSSVAIYRLRGKQLRNVSSSWEAASEFFSHDIFGCVAGCLGRILSETRTKRRYEIMFFNCHKSPIKPEKWLQTRDKKVFRMSLVLVLVLVDYYSE